jgi:hypothetical protein
MEKQQRRVGDGGVNGDSGGLNDGCWMAQWEGGW